MTASAVAGSRRPAPVAPAFINSGRSTARRSAVHAADRSTGATETVKASRRRAAAVHSGSTGLHRPWAARSRAHARASTPAPRTARRDIQASVRPQRNAPATVIAPQATLGSGTHVRRTEQHQDDDRDPRPRDRSSCPVCDNREEAQEPGERQRPWRGCQRNRHPGPSAGHLEL